MYIFANIFFKHTYIFDCTHFKSNIHEIRYPTARIKELSGLISFNMAQKDIYTTLMVKNINIMKHNSSTISVLIPTLNEEVGIQKTISSIPKDRLDKLGYNL
jgi:hypothetical protein